MTADMTREGLAARITAQIAELEGEVMLAGFHGYSIDHIAARLLPLYDEEARIRAEAAAIRGEGK